MIKALVECHTFTIVCDKAFQKWQFFPKSFDLVMYFEKYRRKYSSTRKHIGNELEICLLSFNFSSDTHRHNNFLKNGKKIYGKHRFWIKSV